MPSIAFAVPVKEGGDVHRKELREAIIGEKGHKLHARRRGHGFRRFQVFYQPRPQPMMIIYAEADDIEAAFKNMMEDSHEDHMFWSDKVEQITGRHPQGGDRPQSELMVDWHPEKGHSHTHHN